MNRKILIVDDEYGIIEILTAILENYECDIDSAENGADALELLKVHRYDLVFLDINMPELNGIELLLIIKKHWPQTITVIITGYLTTLKEFYVDSLGAHEYIEKPFSIEDIENVIQKYNSIKEKSH